MLLEVSGICRLSVRLLFMSGSLLTSATKLPHSQFVCQMCTRMAQINFLVIPLSYLLILNLLGQCLAWKSVSHYHDYSFQSGMLGGSESNLFESYSPPPNSNDSCDEIWCDAVESDGRSLYDDLDDEMSHGYWLEPPPDDILYMPFPPIPPSLQAYLLNMENDSLKEFVNSDDPEKDSQCNLCKLFSDPKLYADEDNIYPAASKDNETFVSSFYLMIFSIIFLIVSIMIVLIKYKKYVSPTNCFRFIFFYLF